jgi:integrase
MLQTSLDTESATVASEDSARTARASSPHRALRAASGNAYAKDVALFARFGGTIPCDADAVLRFIEVMRARIAPTTAYRRLHAVRHAHVQAGYPSPTDDLRVRQAWRDLAAGRFPPKPSGKRNKAAPVPVRKPESAKPMTRALLSKMLDAMGRKMLDRRDRALVLLGFMGALKRSALTAIDVADCRFTADALLVTVRTADNAGRSRLLAVPRTGGGDLDAAAAVEQLIEHLALESPTPLFRSFNRAGEPTHNRLAAAMVSVIVKTRLQVVGVDASQFSGESLRRGRLLELPRGAK